MLNKMFITFPLISFDIINLKASDSKSDNGELASSRNCIMLWNVLVYSDVDICCRCGVECSLKLFNVSLSLWSLAFLQYFTVLSL